RFANIKKASAVRGQQPLVQARAVVVAIQIVVFIGEMREGVRAVDNRLEAASARQLADAFDRINLPAQVCDVTEMYYASARRDIPLENLDYLILPLRRWGEGVFFDDDPSPPLALPPRGE